MEITKWNFIQKYINIGNFFSGQLNSIMVVARLICLKRNWKDC